VAHPQSPQILKLAEDLRTARNEMSAATTADSISPRNTTLLPTTFADDNGENDSIAALLRRYGVSEEVINDFFSVYP
jgi:hypothetical protein